MNVLDFSDPLCGKLRQQQQCRSARLTILQRHGHDVAIMLEGITDKNGNTHHETTEKD